MSRLFVVILIVQDLCIVAEPVVTSLNVRAAAAPLWPPTVPVVVMLIVSIRYTWMLWTIELCAICPRHDAGDIACVFFPKKLCVEVDEFVEAPLRPSYYLVRDGSGIA